MDAERHAGREALTHKKKRRSTMNKTKAVAALFAAVALGVATAAWAGERVTLEWDPNNDPAPDQYKLYQRTEGQPYDYAHAVPNPPDHQDGAIPHPRVTFTVTLPTPNPRPPAPTGVTGSFDRHSSQISLTWQQAEAAETVRYYWVVRAEIPPDQSGDSNEVGHDATGESTVARWDVFYSLTPGGPWTKLDSVQNTGQASPAVTAPLTAVPAGGRADVFFTVVALSSDALFSPNAQEVRVDVDRRALEPPTLTIRAVVPVQ
jgi:hypothetical protein